jgi:AcrR family transcriptional regulator
VPSSSDSLRADAERNRAALIAAATEVFGERGLDAPLDEIAKRAGVGSATLYRRFASRRELLVAVFAERMANYADTVRRALDDPDPWSGFASYVRHVCELQSADRALADLVTTPGPGGDELDALRTRAYADLVALVEAAKRAGALRADFAPEDLVVILMANAGLVQRMSRDAPAASARLAALILDGLRADAATLPAPPPLGERTTIAAMRRHARAHGCGE